MVYRIIPLQAIAQPPSDKPLAMDGIEAGTYSSSTPHAVTHAVIDQAQTNPGLNHPLPTVDTLHRPLHDLRISLTDRCNFRCGYCMPKSIFNSSYRYLQQDEILSFAEITRLASIFLTLGVRKIRLTGGEPLLRKNLDQLVEKLAALRTNDGLPPDLTLTTNGALLSHWAAPLRQAGLQRLTVSLDGLSDATFGRMNDVGFPVADVLAGIDAAQAAGFSRIKINMVVQRGINDDQILPMAKHFYGRGVALRFIEYMDVGSTNGWHMQQVIPSAVVLQQLAEHFQLSALPKAAPGETAERWGYINQQGKVDPALGELGFISSVSRAFCGDCNRVRLSPKGEMYTCLFANQGHDLRHFLRPPQTHGDIASDGTIRKAIAAVWQARSDQYSALRQPLDAKNASEAVMPHKVEMSYIGG